MSRWWAIGFLILFQIPARAETVRFHYTPADLCGHTALRVGPNGQTGEWRAWAGAFRSEAYYCRFQPTHMVTFKHPVNCKDVRVPLKMGQGTPRIDYRSSAIVYSYDTYSITVNFLNDGSVDVVYNSGLFRPLE